MKKTYLTDSTILFVLFPTKKNPEKVSLIFEATNISENNYAKF